MKSAALALLAFVVCVGLLVHGWNEAERVKAHADACLGSQDSHHVPMDGAMHRLPGTKQDVSLGQFHRMGDGRWAFSWRSGPATTRHVVEGDDPVWSGLPGPGGKGFTITTVCTQVRDHPLEKPFVVWARDDVWTLEEDWADDPANDGIPYDKTAAEPTVSQTT